MGRSRKRNGLSLHGWVVLNKRAGISSAKAVAEVLTVTGAAKAGHGGTLDPFSEGVLPIALGEATKTLSMVLEGDKGYLCWIKFGQETDSGDLTGTVITQSDLLPTREAVEALLPRFTGVLQQVPPMHSAVHVGGERAYELARRGEVVDLPPREVTIRELTLEAWEDHGVAVVRVLSSKGTYMRALARDLGRALGCGAHLVRLLRTRALGFELKEAIGLDELRSATEQGRSGEVILPIDRVLDGIPVLRLGEEAWRSLRHGQTVWIEEEGIPSGFVRVRDASGAIRALGEVSRQRDDQGRRACRSKRILHVS